MLGHRGLGVWAGARVTAWGGVEGLGSDGDRGANVLRQSRAAAFFSSP